MQVTLHKALEKHGMMELQGVLDHFGIHTLRDLRNMDGDVFGILQRRLLSWGCIGGCVVMRELRSQPQCLMCMEDFQQLTDDDWVSARLTDISW